MKWRLLAIFWTALWVSLPALAANPFGSFGGQVGGTNSGAGVMRFHGWCLDDDGVSSVDFYIDGIPVGRAQYGTQRTGVANNFPGFPDSEAAGFGISINTARFNNGVHVVQPLCISETGEETFLNARAFQFTNTTHNLVPFGKINFPNPNSQLFGTCGQTPPLEGPRYNIISGWALDAGVEIGDQGLGYVELLVDGAVLFNTRTSCFFDEDLGGLTNCYGLERADIEQRFPGLVDAPNAGWRFALDVGGLINAGFSRGQHVITIRAGDISGQFANIDEQNVVFLCTGDRGNEGSFGRIGTPRDGLTYRDTIAVTGWALDWEGVSRIDVLVDEVLAGSATLGFLRPGVSEFYPGFPESHAPGFSYLLDTTVYEDGNHDVQVHVIDDEGERTLLGERTIRVNNAIATN